jgi:Abortive infection alpha
MLSTSSARAAARERRLDELARKTQHILRNRDVAGQQEVPEDIAIPLLEAAQGESREKLQELWARLLANAMDPNRSHDVRPEFIGTLRQLQPIDARILAVAPDPSRSGYLEPGKTAADMKQRLTSVQVSINRLVALDCLFKHMQNNDVIQMTPCGSELRHALKE